MGTVVSSNSGAATAYGSQRKIDRCQNGVLWTVMATADRRLGAAYSTDNGATWTSVGTIGAIDGSYFPDASLFIDLDDYAHVVYKDTSDGYIKYQRGTPNAARTAYTWSAATALYSSTDMDFPDIVAFRDPAIAGAWSAHVVMSPVGNTSAKVYYKAISIASSGAITTSPTGSGQLTVIGNIPAANTSASFPSIDFNHTGDGKTVAGGTPHLYVGWSAGTTGSGYGIRFRKATYASGSWTWGTEREIDNTHFHGGATSGNWLTCHYDGTRVVLAGQLGLSSGSQELLLHDRDASDPASGGTTLRTLQAATIPSALQLNFGTSTYDDQGNVYLFGVNGSASGSAQLAYRKWVRSAGSAGGRVSIDETANTQPHVSARRGPQGQAIDYVYTDGTASPFFVQSSRQMLNQAPTAPTWVTADNSTTNASQDIPVLFKHNDPDGDSASKWDLRYRAAGTTGAWVTLTNTSSAVNGGTITALIPADTVGGVLELQARTYDPSNTAGAWSTSITMLVLPSYTAGGVGGSSLSFMQLYTMTQSERSLRALGLA